jgi:ferredoxin
MTHHKTFLICNCEKSMTLDGKAIGQALGLGELPVHSHLCRSGVAAFETALADGKPLCVGCTQESPLFAEIASEAGHDAPTFFNIREMAGWTKAAKPPVAKIAALMANAALEVTPTRTKTVTSDGLCLVYGAGQQALEAAGLINRQLSVTLLLKDAADVLLPPVLDIPVFSGTLRQATGTLGAFEVTVDGYAPMLPSSRAAPQFAMARNNAKSACSVIVDLSGDPPLFTRPEVRDGYFRADPADVAGVLRTILDASDYAGEFEKPIYVGYDASLCVHSRSKKPGCNKCIDNCPAGAITPNGDEVAIDANICGGCGNCAAHCPTGAVSYLSPPRPDVIGRIQTLASTYLAAGGEAPVLLLHDAGHGVGLIGAMARAGRGLPANVVPLQMHAVSGLGHDTMLAALAAGFRHVVVLADPRKLEEMAAFEAESIVVKAILEGLSFEPDRLTLLAEADPDAAEARLWSLTAAPEIARKSFHAVGNKREVVRTALAAILEHVPQRPDAIAMPASAPYGRVAVDTAACTLCLACVSACPADAIRDNPDRPQLRFVESACVQCGLCASTCPEHAITLEARLNLSPSAMQPMVLHEEEPFACIRCGKPFAAKSSVERIAERLGGKHWMFGSEERVSLIKMCDTCRLEALSEMQGGDPFAIAQRPRPRTTDDYIAADKKGLSVDDFIKDD